MILQPPENEGQSIAEMLLAEKRLIDRAGLARTSPVDSSNLMLPSSTTSPTIDSRRICANRFKLALDFLDREPKSRITGDAPHDQVVGVNHRRMVAPEMLADGRKRAVGQLAAQVHRNLAAERDVLGALLRLQIRQPYMEKIRDRLLYRIDIRLRL